MQKNYDAAMLIFLLLFFTTATGVISIKFFGNDNPIEEAAEEIIKLQTGQDVDLSPGEEDAAYQVTV